MLCVMFLASCAGGLDYKSPSFSFSNGYDKAVKAYHTGQVMQARERVLAMNPKDEDYKKARRLLRKVINPARLRLVRHYKALGKEADEKGLWDKAIQYYLQASEFSAQPKIFHKKAHYMELKMRQKRMNMLLAQRRLEDKAWLAWAGAYEPPLGVDAHDVAYARMRELMQDDLNERADRAYSEAKRNLSRNMPDVAYVEVESFLRLRPGSDSGKALMLDVRKAMPKGLSIVSKSSVNNAAKAILKQNGNKKIRKRDVLALMKKGRLLKAKKLAVLYRRQSGDGGDQLLRDIAIKMKKSSAMLFKQGNVAFRNEHIAMAVSLWRKAVAFQPNNMEYADALRRAEQLQDRLKLLRTSDK